MIEVNLLGAVTTTEVFLDQLRSNGVYAATKWGINGWSESLRQELLPDVRVTVVEPGPWAAAADDAQRNEILVRPTAQQG
jgi:NADP-dependent 3-hydroxy acid dehydrogenase YdfG